MVPVKAVDMASAVAELPAGRVVVAVTGAAVYVETTSELYSANREASEPILSFLPKVTLCGGVIVVVVVVVVIIGRLITQIHTSSKVKGHLHEASLDVKMFVLRQVTSSHFIYFRKSTGN